jgi:hypothetical protein
MVGMKPLEENIITKPFKRLFNQKGEELLNLLQIEGNEEYLVISEDGFKDVTFMDETIVDHSLENKEEIIRQF